MAAVKKVRGRTWEDRETKLLLEKWGDENIQLRLKSCTRKKPIWQEIGDFLMACGYEDRDGEGCKTRLHTLVTAYRQHKDECLKTGNGTPSRKPPFFDELDVILSDKPSTKPKYVINSTKIVVASCDEETGNGDDDKLKDENIDPNVPSCSSIREVEVITAAKCTQEICVTETTKENGEKKKVFSGKKRRLSATDGLSKIDKSLEAFVSYQQEADRRFLEAEEAREKREQERDEKRRKEDQEFFIKLIQVLKK